MFGLSGGAPGPGAINSTVGKVVALHMVDLGLILNIRYRPPSPPGVTPACRKGVSLSALPPKQNKCGVPEAEACLTCSLASPYLLRAVLS